ncbi:hypothetical protein [Azospirillum picis]|uniref:Uncharacterized protein n=1 Tax=Azospirillum picis TaxID=488438 RepID=A0ABU0ME80_9PROT|nr:hypothetical protein [Azospirillum picis]MBP2297406.1 hypothetical protein [Azospirillum picis]MDQ0531571.1 hypothetical protein [Azospirillum picis]
MPIRYEGDLARFDAACTVDEALPFAEWLEATVPARVDLSACTELHTALLQLLLVARPAVAATAADPFLARWVAPLLEAPPAPPVSA